MTIRCDVRRRADVRAAVDADSRRSLDAIDVLINNAGVIQVGPLEHMRHEDFENAMATHFWGPLHLMLELIPAMRRRGFGRIVNIASIGGRIAVPHLGAVLAPASSRWSACRTRCAPSSRRTASASRRCRPGLMRTGSPINAQIKGQHEAEYAWFAIADSLPGLSIVRRARRAIRSWTACRYGDPELTITLPAERAMAARTLAPGRGRAR